MNIFAVFFTVFKSIRDHFCHYITTVQYHWFIYHQYTSINITGSNLLSNQWHPSLITGLYWFKSCYRLLTTDDPQDVTMYPLMTRRCARRRTVCRLCNHSTVRFCTLFICFKSCAVMNVLQVTDEFYFYSWNVSVMHW